MRLSEKIQKLANGSAWESLLDSYYRWKRPLSVDRLFSQIDPKKLRRLQDEFGVPGEKKAWPKYINDPREWLALAVRQVRELHLDRKKPLQILDLGSGAGFFLYVCRQLGHDGMGLDLDRPSLYAETFKLMGLRRIIWRIEPFQPLPDLHERFDLVTAYAVCFNSHDTSKVWGVPEWGFFLNNLEETVMAPGGEMFFALNPEPYGFYTPELKEFFVNRGARIERHKIWLTARS